MRRAVIFAILVVAVASQNVYGMFEKVSQRNQIKCVDLILFNTCKIIPGIQTLISISIKPKMWEFLTKRSIRIFTKFQEGNFLSIQTKIMENELSFVTQDHHQIHNRKTLIAT